MKRAAFVFVTCLVCAMVAAQTAALLSGADGVQGSAGASGAAGPTGPLTVGLGVSCSTLGLELGANAGGQRIVCGASSTRFASLLGPANGVNGSAQRVAVQDVSGGTVYVTATGPFTALHIEDTVGHGLVAGGVVDLSATKLRIPFRRVVATGDNCTDCDVAVACNGVNERVISGSCYATDVGPATQLQQQVIFDKRCYANGGACVDPALETPTQFLCGVAGQSPAVDVHVEALCWRE